MGETMNWLDKIISVFDPVRACERAYFRESLRQYDAAATDRLNGDWAPVYGTAEQVAGVSRDIIRGRARAAELNSDLAESAIKALLRNVIGTGIKPQAKIRSKNGKLNTQLNKKIEDAWDKWIEAEHSDVRAISTFYELQEMALRRLLYDGEILINKTAVGNYLPLSIQLIEAENIGAVSMNNGNNDIINGVEVNENGRPLAYHVYKSDPLGMRSFQATRLPVSQAFLLYQPKRPSQLRGISELSLVLKRIHDIDEFMDADLIAARVAACFSAFVTGENSGRQLVNLKKDYKGRKLKGLAPGVIHHLTAGESVSFAEPRRNASNAAEYSATQSRRVSAGLGMSSEIVTRQITGNFSAARQNLLEDQKTFKPIQLFMIKHFCMPIWKSFIEACFLKGILNVQDYVTNKERYTAVSWLTPGWSWIDPVKEVSANKESVKAGMTTLEDICSAQGKDWEEVLEQRKVEQDRARELGVILDLDGDLSTLIDDDQKEGDIDGKNRE